MKKEEKNEISLIGTPTKYYMFPQVSNNVIDDGHKRKNGSCVILD